MIEQPYNQYKDELLKFCSVSKFLQKGKNELYVKVKTYRTKHCSTTKLFFILFKLFFLVFTPPYILYLAPSFALRFQNCPPTPAVKAVEERERERKGKGRGRTLQSIKVGCWAS